MSRIQNTPIGFDRRVNLEWLDAVAEHLAAGTTASGARRLLWDMLDGLVAGAAINSARGKTITVLMRIWVTVPPVAVMLRDSALAQFPAAMPEERLALHWAMSAASYPFFFDVAANIGKLIALNGQASLSQVIRRMTETWGDRTTLPRAVQRVLRSMVQWGALQESRRPGNFTSASHPIKIPDGIACLLVQATLIGQGHGMVLAKAMGQPALFPFDIHLNANILRQCAHVRIHRQVDMSDYLELMAP